ncbi:hypothetical protein LOAG_17539 [Loa loa]|nr:hypothetical protein LOAG_17539 [Loa loa]EJD75282.1 hypothetical protein LOAG_17539 [Loa loa]
MKKLKSEESEKKKHRKRKTGFGERPMSRAVHDEKRERVEKEGKQKSQIGLNGKAEFGSTRQLKISLSESMNRVEKTRYRSRSPSHHKYYRGHDR